MTMESLRFLGMCITCSPFDEVHIYKEIMLIKKIDSMVRDK